MMRFIVLWMALALICSTGSALAAESPAPIAAVRDAWLSEFTVKEQRAEHIEAVARLYANDATLYTGESGDRAKGAAAIRQLLRKVMSTMTVDLVLSPRSSGTFGALGFEGGDYEETLTPIGGQPRHIVGTYLMVFRRDAGRWLIQDQAWTETAAGR